LSVLVASVSNSAFGPTAFQDEDSSKTILKVLEAEPSTLAAAIYTSEGARLAEWRRDTKGFGLPPKFSDAQLHDGFVGGYLQISRSIAQAGQPQVGTLRVVFSTRDISARTQRFLQIAGSVLLVAMLLAAVIASIAQRVLTKPVHILAEAARLVQERQDFTVRAARVSSDELGHLTDAFNAMLSMIQGRDRELEDHRLHLEETVSLRTRDLDERNQAMRLVFDNVEQGFVTLDKAGRIGAERSAIFDSWFGLPAAETPFALHVGAQAPGFQFSFDLLWTQLIEGFLPLELNLAQLPSRVHTTSGKHYELAYRPIHQMGEQFEQVLVIVSDVTARVEKEQSDAEQAQIMALFENITNDRGGFKEFLDEASMLVERLITDKERDLKLVQRELHTLKGNFGMFELKPLARLVHGIESQCIESGEGIPAEQSTELQQAWLRFAEKARGFLGSHPTAITVEQSELDALVAAVRSGASAQELSAQIARLSHEPVTPKLSRMGERARALAKRLGKAPIEIQVQADGVRAAHDVTWLWHVLPHAVNNSIDHGIDTPEQREAAGKGIAKLRLSAVERAGELIVEIEDNGQGIDWQRVRDKAARLGLRAATEDDLVDALFAQGLSTRDEASEVSGRGVGLSALREACREHAGHVKIISKRGSGTTLRITLSVPVAANTNATVTSRRTG
ncbi:MAG: hypothetical protein RL701_2674, partial [Pseudomonadota bacterium]